jgi:hypothetical protein
MQLLGPRISRGGVSVKKKMVFWLILAMFFGDSEGYFRGLFVEKACFWLNSLAGGLGIRCEVLWVFFLTRFLLFRMEVKKC